MSTAEHFRRCHCCGALNANTEQVDRCQDCAKPLAQFFYFDEKTVEPFDEMGRSEVVIPKRGKYLPIVGLSTYWPLED